MSITRVELHREHAAAAAFQKGFADGQAASLRNEPLSPYLRVGLDDYAKGYRSGFYSMKARRTTSDLKNRVASGRVRALAKRL